MSTPVVSFTVDKFKGFSGMTRFNFNAYISPITDVSKILWHFGDGVTSDVQNPSHVYQTTGTYEVSLTVYGNNFDNVILKKTITIELFLNESIYLESVPPPTFAGHINKRPFRVVITSSSAGEHYVSLGAIFSKSYSPEENVTKWAFLKPTWNFLNTNFEKVQSIKTTDTIIKVNESGEIDPNGTLVMGVTGYADFYFTDDCYNVDLALKDEPYTTIIATLQTSAIDITNPVNFDLQLPSFANSKAAVSYPYLFLWRTPDILNITENGLRYHTNPRWATSNIPLVVSCGIREFEYPEDLNDGNLIKPAFPETYFVHNFPLPGEPDLRFEIGLDAVSAKFTPEPKFQWTNSSGIQVPGYYKGSMDVDDLNTYATSITARIDINSPALSANGINPFLWISDPSTGLVHAAQYLYNPSVSSVLSTKSETFLKSIEVPVSTSGELSGAHGIYYFQALNYPSYHAWALDSDSQFLYRISTTGQILCAIDINRIVADQDIDYLIPDIVSPASFVLDSKSNIWMALYDTNYILKLDSVGNFLMLINPLTAIGNLTKPYPADIPASQQVLSIFDQESFFTTNTSLTGFDDNNLLEPAYIDTDIYDNVYVSYTNSLCAMVVKYSPEGTVLTVLSNLSDSVPQEIVCDRLGNFWLNAKHKYSHGYYIERRNSEGSLYADHLGNPRRIGPFYSVNNMTIDRNQNIWITHADGPMEIGALNVSRINSETYEVETIDMPNSFGEEVQLPFNSLEGICTDYRNRVYVINSVENKMYIINGYTFKIENSFFINPQRDIYSYLNLENKTIFAYNKYAKAAQAAGDWSGLRWANKYTSYLGTSQLTLSGFSPKLDFYVDDSVSYDLFRFNETFDLPQHMSELASPSFKAKSGDLITKFFGGVFGTEDVKSDDLGVELFEQIANFVPNHSDVDECNIDQLYSLAQMVDLKSDDFILNYPPAIKRLLNIASINLSRLWGARNFDTTLINGNTAPNRGKLLSSLNYTVSAGTPVILKNKNYPKFQLIYTGKINNKNKYDLDVLADYLNLNKNSAWTENYDFYEFKNSSPGNFLYGCIDWDSDLTSIHKQKSSIYLNSLPKQNVEFNPSFIAVSDRNGLYPSETTYDLKGEYLYINSNGIPYPAKAGTGINDGVNFPLIDKNSIIKQKYNFKFIYRGGSETTNAHPVSLSKPVGMTIHGVPIYNSAAPSKVINNLSAANLFNWNRVPLKSSYKLDFVDGGITSDGKYFYIDGLFLYQACNDYKFWSKNAYLSNTEYQGDHFRHRTGHSKIIGFCFDGYPIYGPYGYSNPADPASNIIRQTTSYRKQTVVPLGRNYSFEEVPVGNFVQDYIYEWGLGSLDRYNGRFCITPEYPQGTYAYFLTFEDDALTTPAYPYITALETKERRDLAPLFDNQLPFTLEDWEGDGGFLDTMFVYELYKGLNLLK